MRRDEQLSCGCGASFFENQNIALYPNPTSGKIHIALSEYAIHCQIVGLTGNVLQETSPSNLDFELDLSGFPSGMYLIKLLMSDGKSAYRKVVKQ